MHEIMSTDLKKRSYYSFYSALYLISARTCIW